MTLLMLIGAAIILAAGFIVRMPNDVFNTASCKRNGCVILSVFTGGFLVIEQNEYAAISAAIMTIGIVINYAFPVLLNVLSTFNRKSDP